MKRIEKFHENLQFNRLDVRRIVEAQLNGVIETYTLTTVSTMNARRDPNICLWCGKVQSIDHDCESKPDYNCWFTFGEEGEGVAFVKVSRYGMQHGEERVLEDDAFDPDAHKLFDEESEASTSGAHQVFDGMSKLNSAYSFGLSVGLALNVDHSACHNHPESNNIEYIVTNSGELPPKIKDGAEISDAHKVLDEMPLPDFIREMARVSEPNSKVIQRQNENETKELKEKNVQFMSKRDEAIVVEKELTTRRKVDVMKALESLPYKEDQNQRIDDLHQKRVTELNEVHYDRKIHTCFPIAKRHMCHLRMRGSYKYFDPGIKVLKLGLCHIPTLEDKGDFRGEEDKILEEYSRKRFIVVVLWRTKCHMGMCTDIVSSTGISIVISRCFRMTFLYGLSFFGAILFTFDPGGLEYETYRDGHGVADGTGVGASQGILIKGGQALETAHKVNCIVFDKTGTLTEGKPLVVSTRLLKQMVLRHFYELVGATDINRDINREHPLAKVVVEYSKTFREDDENLGVKAIVQNKEILVGNKSLILDQGITVFVEAEELLKEAEGMAQTGILVSIEGELTGVIAISDPLKLTAKDVISILKSVNVKSIMVTDDNKSTAHSIATLDGRDTVIAEAKPEQTAEKIKELQAEGYIVARVGYDINDFPYFLGKYYLLEANTEHQLTFVTMAIPYIDWFQVFKASSQQHKVSKCKQNVIVCCESLPSMTWLFTHDYDNHWDVTFVFDPGGSILSYVSKPGIREFTQEAFWSQPNSRLSISLSPLRTRVF